jgi:hypothetical protein
VDSISRNEAREEVLLDALVEPVNMAQIHWRVQQHHASASVPELQSETIEVVRSLVADGLVETGYPGPDGDFVREPFTETMQEIRDTYIARYDEPAEWMWSCWLNLTDKGRQLATSTEAGARVARLEDERRTANDADVTSSSE